MCVAGLARKNMKSLDARRGEGAEREQQGGLGFLPAAEVGIL